MNFYPFPKITSNSITLRQILPSDCESILFLRSDEEVNKFIQRPEDRKTKNLEDAKKFIEELTKNLEINKSIAWGISLENEFEIVGTICLWNFSSDEKTAEVGYDLKPNFQGKGIMSTALKCVLAYGFDELNLELIEAYTDKENISSRVLLEKNNFKCTNDKKDDYNLNNVVYEIKNPTLKK